jgi:polyhydroxyalkanoate synthesis repressor PhaR
MDDAAPKPTVTIKKYANRRLYNTATSSYVTLDHLGAMVKEGVEFNVYDAKTGEDITRSVLTQIIVEEEGKAGQNLLPISFLRQLIGFYGDNMQWLVPKYLEHSMQTLAKNQEQIRTYFQSAFGGMFPFGSTLEEMGKQNMAMFERAMRLFSPFGGGSASESFRPEAAAAPAPAEQPPVARKPTAVGNPSPAAAAMPVSSVMPKNVTPLAGSDDAASDQDVQRKIAALQRQLADLAKNKA